MSRVSDSDPLFLPNSDFKISLDPEPVSAPISLAKKREESALKSYS